MQPAGESAGMFWPVRAFFRDIVTDQIGGDAQSGLRSEAAPAPLGGFGHSLRMQKPRVHLDEAFDRGFAVCIFANDARSDMKRSGCRGQKPQTPLRLSVRTLDPLIAFRRRAWRVCQIDL